MVDSGASSFARISGWLLNRDAKEKSIDGAKVTFKFGDGRAVESIGTCFLEFRFAGAICANTYARLELSLSVAPGVLPLEISSVSLIERGCSIDFAAESIPVGEREIAGLPIHS